MITNEPIRRSIFRQDENFSYFFDISLDNLLGSCHFGFSDESSNNLINFEMKNGRVFVGGKFVYAYSANNILKIFGRVDQTSHNLYIDDKLISLSAQRLSGPVNSFFISPVDCEVQFDFSLKGSQPKFLVSNFFFDGESTIGNGSIVNFSEKPFLIFGGSVSPATYFLNSIPQEEILGEQPITIGKKNLSKDSTFDSSYKSPITINLFTNFGKITKEVIESTVYPISQVLSLDIGNSINGIGEVSGLLEWENYDGEVIIDRGLLISISLEEISSQGNFFDTWDLKISDADGSNEIDFLTTDRMNFDNNKYLTNVGEYITNRIGTIRITLARKQNLGTDMAKLKIVGISETIEIEITGTEE